MAFLKGCWCNRSHNCKQQKKASKAGGKRCFSQPNQQQLLKVSLPSLLSLWTHHYLQFKSSHHTNATESLEVTWAADSNSFWEYQSCDRQGMCTQSTGVHPDAGEHLRTWDEANQAQTLRSLELVISTRHKHTLWRLWASTLSTWQHQATFWNHIHITACITKPVKVARSQLCMHRYLSAND